MPKCCTLEIHLVYTHTHMHTHTQLHTHTHTHTHTHHTHTLSLSLKGHTHTKFANLICMLFENVHQHMDSNEALTVVQAVYE